MYHAYKLNLLIFQRIFNFYMNFIIDNDFLKQSGALKNSETTMKNWENHSENDFHRFYGRAPNSFI